MKHRPDPIAAWDAIVDLAAEDDMASYQPTPDDLQWARRVDAMVQARLDTLQHQITRSRSVIKRGVAIPREIQALGRPELLARLEAMRQRPGVRYAHQDLTGLSDHDLRTMLVVLMKKPGR